MAKSLSVDSLLETLCSRHMAASIIRSDDPHAYSSGGKSAPFSHNGLSAKPSQHGHQDQSSMFDTPSLTTGSTRSTTSSMSAWEDCQCPSPCDSESMRYQQGDEEYVVYFFRF